MEANARDVEWALGRGLTAAAIERLTLNPKRLGEMAGALEEIIRLPDPVGEVLDGAVRPNGLRVRRVRVPLGVVFFIYESRPNVTVDAGALCVKSGNAVILRGGKEALHSNLALHRVLAEELTAVGLPAEAVQLVGTHDRAVVGELLQRSREITVTIPRGGKGLIERVTAEARMPVIKHFDGVCHVYVDAGADLALAGPIVVNAKCQRPGVCNAAECLLVHEGVATGWLPGFGRELQQRGVELRGCERTCALVPGAKRATEADYATEYGELKLSVKVVSSLDEALAHIERFGSHHTDAIVTEDVTAARRFLAEVDSAAVMLNASTRFNDGG
ncbi:MAG: glutamate-5-semialdehyde dehydrogenase, partial [Planctomycetaceae bacterium]